MPYRNDVKCREKWLNVLTPFIQRAEFNEEEDKALEAGMRSCFVWYIPVLLCHTEVNNYLSAIQEHGVGNWAAIRKSLPARTSEQCARRWQKLQNQARKKQKRLCLPGTQEEAQPPKGKRQRKELGNSAVPNAKGKLKITEHEKLGTEVEVVAVRADMESPVLVRPGKIPYAGNARTFVLLQPEKATEFRAI